jgi:antirestriction protein ArdC
MGAVSNGKGETQMTTTRTDRPDVYQQVTDRIVAAIEAGAGDFQMPWHRGAHASSRPLNVDTGNLYRGVNVLSLWVAAQGNGFSTSLWGTYRQWQNRGAQVRKGEKASLVVFYKELEFETADTDTGEAAVGKRLMARASWVFNADQVDGYILPAPEVPNPVQAIAAAEAFVLGTGADIRYGGTRAFYRPSEDFVQMPPKELFTGTATSSATESFYATLFHEICHWVGHKSRCDRQFGERFGSDAYAMEELVAELGAAFLCADLGISVEPRPDHAAYIASWLKVLKNDKRAVFTAASKAMQAADHLIGLQPLPVEAAA